MLYERWCAVASERRTEIALRDLTSGKRWTFEQLRIAAESRAVDSGEIIYPQSNSLEFILSVLAAWRFGKIVSPLDLNQAPPQIAPPPRHCVHLKSTSATTGARRWVVFTEQQLQADADNIVETMSLRQDWPNLGVISMAHSYGFSNLALPLLLHGIPLILVNSALPEMIRRVAKEESAITLAAVPALWRAWYEAQTIPPNIRLGVSAGAPLPSRLEQSIFQANGLKVHNFYGSTECGGIAYDASDAPRKDDACVGSPIRNVDVALNCDGCLTVSSRAVGETYWPEPSETLRDGKFQTSDLAELKDGTVFLRGRLSDLINVSGRKVSPDDIERALLNNSAIRECLVFGIPTNGGERGERIVACVVAATQVTAESLRHFLLAKIPAWQIPREWWFIESLAANERGKLSRAEWRTRYLEGIRNKTLSDTFPR